MQDPSTPQRQRKAGDPTPARDFHPFPLLQGAWTSRTSCIKFSKMDGLNKAVLFEVFNIILTTPRYLHHLPYQQPPVQPLSVPCYFPPSENQLPLLAQAPTPDSLRSDSDNSHEDPKETPQARMQCCSWTRERSCPTTVGSASVLQPEAQFLPYSCTLEHLEKDNVLESTKTTQTLSMGSNGPAKGFPLNWALKQTCGGRFRSGCISPAPA